MKQINFGIWGLLFFLFVSLEVSSSQPKSSTPETVYSIRHIVRSNEWYLQQAKLWKKEIAKNTKNAEAWYNYYKANRYVNFDNGESEQKQAELKHIIEDMGTAIPNSFEYLYLKACNMPNTNGDQRLNLLTRAYQLEPERPEIIYEFIDYYILNNDDVKIKAFCEKLYNSRDLAPGLINYNYNVLMSTEKNAILFTNGDNDTYPVWMLQYAFGIRQDVTVLNLHMVKRLPNFLESNLEKKGMKIDFSNLPALKDNAFLKHLCQTLSEKYPIISIYFALTVSESFTKSFMSNLYIVGLAYQYESKRIDNLALLKKNFETNLRLDYLKFDWYEEQFPATSLVLHLNTNYVLPMIMLSDHYKTSGEDDKAQDWKNRALTLAQKAGNQKLISYLANTGSPSNK